MNHLNQDPYSKSNPETIQKMFGTIAKSYDKTNGILSLQMHKWWNRELIKQTTLHRDPEILLDLCSGTGEIAFQFLQDQPSKKSVYLLDFCQEMLHESKRKADLLGFQNKHDLTFLQADAMEIPLPGVSVDLVTMGYGIRNVHDPVKCFKEVFRVLTNGGTFGILELTEPQNSLLRFGHKLYLNKLLPFLGGLFSSNKAAYTYLSQSIGNFSKPTTLMQLLRASGFTKTRSIPLLGGVATIIIAEK
jgi:demethylmenaquinone methyltransferase/2-methoxy-6-polyprenyl-1,4-benzoquinol methylase